MKKVYETGSVSTLNEMNSFFAMIRELFPVIDEFINAHNHELINSHIANNECYLITFKTGKIETERRCFMEKIEQKLQIFLVRMKLICFK